MAFKSHLSRWNGLRPAERHITYFATLRNLCGAPHKFRIGDFYELFNEDAETAGKLLGLTLTTRDRTISMAGFPHHSLETYLRKLLKAGQRVAICEQVEPDDRPKGQVRREITRVVTPGTQSMPSRAHDSP